MHGYMRALARAMALLGGGTLLSLVLLVCSSVISREIGASFPVTGFKPILGDFELVEAGMAFTIFCFIPLCQIDQGHAIVEVFTGNLPKSSQRVLIWVSEMLFAAVLVVIAVQIFAGTLSKQDSGQTTQLLQFPIWWAYAAASFGAVISAFVGCYMAAARTLELFSGRDILPQGEGAEH